MLSKNQNKWQNERKEQEKYVSEANYVNKLKFINSNVFRCGASEDDVEEEKWAKKSEWCDINVETLS